MLPSIVVAIVLASLAGGDDEIAAASWDFRHADKPVKVTLLAGSIGAYPQGNYTTRLEQVCKNIEVKNLSKVGLGAFPLKQHFKKQVLENRRLNVRGRKDEQWLLLQSGLNSIGMPMSTNHHLKNTIVLAKMAGMKVVALSPTPWGTNASSKFKGLEGLRRRDATQLVTDFILGRLDATQALGSHADRRPDGALADWVPLEVPDVRVDLYDSRLRDREAEVRDVDAMKRLLLADRTWRDEHAALDDAQREQALQRDAERGAAVPQWFMKPELHAFDHVHPNADGHLVMAQTVCPKLPASWGCDCAGLTP